MNDRVFSQLVLGNLKSQRMLEMERLSSVCCEQSSNFVVMEEEEEELKRISSRLLWNGGTGKMNSTTVLHGSCASQGKREKMEDFHDSGVRVRVSQMFSRSRSSRRMYFYGEQTLPNVS